MNDPIVIVGGGIAGLMAALAAAPRPVLLLNPNGLGETAASAWSQGGLAAAIGADDNAALHIADTLAAGAGLCAPEAVQRIISAGPALIDTLVRLGVKFDRTPDGKLALGLEAAHARHRILHAHGDQTGSEIMRALIAAVRQAPHVSILTATARHIFVGDAGITGLLATTPSGEAHNIATSRLLLATGGIGGLFRDTTNPPAAIGAGLSLAIAAGARTKNLEFVQFHPTALATDGAFMPLISEAVRGDGAFFIDETGATFMHGNDLAPRDIVARAVFAHAEAGHRTFLDARPIGARFATRFPAIYAICQRAGLDPARDPIPVRPAAHYHMGGIAVDAEGESCLPGLFAAGEVACTGLHGANRLASNSLLEAAICGQAAGQALAARPSRHLPALPDISIPPLPDATPIRALMSAKLGVLRDAAGLTQAIAQLTPRAAHNPAAALGLAIAEAALIRRESVGAHTRRDAAPVKQAA